MRGELDNRVRGRVTGRIWFAGRAEPVVLELEGNCWRDLAGRRLEFSNPQPKPGDIEKLAPLQRGTVGDISASRKVKVPDVPLSDLHLYYKTGREMPWHWGNALMLEWFSERNGRVVIETASFDLKIVGEATWEMSESEEEEQRKANGAAMTGFMERLAEAAGTADREIVDATPAEWDEKPQTEEEAEAEQARSDKLADRIQARLAREGKSADYQKILEEEMDRLDREEGREPLTPEELERNAGWIDEMNEAAEKAAENPDLELEAEMAIEHPVATRAQELAEMVEQTAEDEKWIPQDAHAEHPATELTSALTTAGIKLAATLNGRTWPPDIAFCAHTIVRLKRALAYLEDALNAAESCREEKIIQPRHLGPIVVEIIDLVDDTAELISELREKLERGKE